jgi:hypothetical protein
MMEKDDPLYINFMNKQSKEQLRHIPKELWLDVQIEEDSPIMDDLTQIFDDSV